MSKQKSKLPTPEELSFYRQKSKEGSYIERKQLTAVFAMLDAETERADLAEEKLKHSPLIFPTMDEIQRLHAFAIEKSETSQSGWTFYDGVLATTAWLLGELEIAPDE